MNNEQTNNKTFEVPDWFEEAAAVLGERRVSAVLANAEALAAEIRAGEQALALKRAELDSVGDRVRQAVQIARSTDAEILRILGAPAPCPVERMAEAAAGQQAAAMMGLLGPEPCPEPVPAKKPTQSFSLWVSNLRRAATRQGVTLPETMKAETPWKDWHEAGMNAAETLQSWGEYRQIQPGADEKSDVLQAADPSDSDATSGNGGAEGQGGEEGRNDTGYDPGHPWYYKLGGKPLPADQILPGPVLDSDVENAASGLRLARMKDQAKRDEKVRQAIADHERDLAGDVAAYQDLLTRGAEALSERSSNPNPVLHTEGTSSPLDNALAAKHNHILYHRSHIAALRKLLGGPDATPAPTPGAPTVITDHPFTRTDLINANAVTAVNNDRPIPEPMVYRGVHYVVRGEADVDNGRVTRWHLHPAVSPDNWAGPEAVETPAARRAKAKRGKPIDWDGLEVRDVKGRPWVLGRKTGQITLETPGPKAAAAAAAE